MSIQTDDIQPEDMRDHLARQAGTRPATAGGAAGERPEGAREAAPHPQDAPAPGPEDPAREALLRSIAASYFSLRIGLALLAFAMPLLLWVLAGMAESSISAYYYHADGGGGLPGRAPRDIFVGVLCAIGAFLWLYKGYRTSENVALNLAGLFALLIALFPTDPASATLRTPVGTVHQVAAVGYFIAIAYVCWFEAKTTLSLLRNPALERIFLSLYRLLAAAMLLLPAAVFLLYRFDTPNPPPGGRIFWLEFVAIYVFAAFWLVKSFEIRRIQRQENA